MNNSQGIRPFPFYTLELFEKTFRRMLDDIAGLPWWVKSSLPIQAKIRLLQLWPLLYHAGLDSRKRQDVMHSASQYIRQRFCRDFFFEHPKALEESLEFRTGIDVEALPSARALFEMMSSDEARDADVIEPAHFKKAS